MRQNGNRPHLLQTKVDVLSLPPRKCQVCLGFRDRRSREVHRPTPWVERALFRATSMTFHASGRLLEFLRHQLASREAPIHLRRRARADLPPRSAARHTPTVSPSAHRRPAWHAGKTLRPSRRPPPRRRSRARSVVRATHAPPPPPTRVGSKDRCCQVEVSVVGATVRSPSATSSSGRIKSVTAAPESAPSWPTPRPPSQRQCRLSPLDVSCRYRGRTVRRGSGP